MSAVRGDAEDTGDKEPGDPADPDTDPPCELPDETGESVGLARSRELGSLFETNVPNLGDWVCI